MFAMCISRSSIAPGDGGWDLPHLWSQMGTPAKAVVIILFIMSAYSIGVMIDRLAGLQRRP